MRIMEFKKKKVMKNTPDVLLYVSMLTLRKQIYHADVRFSCLSQLVNEKRASDVSHRTLNVAELWGDAHD